MYELDFPEFTKSDFEFIYEYIKVTKPIAIALDSLQGDIDASYGNLIPTLFGIKSKITNINNLKYCDALVKALLNGLQTRFATYLNLELESKHAILATISNPKFKLNFLTTDI